MPNIVIKDLEESRELDRRALARVIGGTYLRGMLGIELASFIYQSGIYQSGALNSFWAPVFSPHAPTVPDSSTGRGWMWESGFGMYSFSYVRFFSFSESFQASAMTAGI